MEPLAYRVRPRSFDDIVGQDRLVGPNGVIRQMLAKDLLTSLILYGPPGTGKTSIAGIIGEQCRDATVFYFGASVDNKKKLKDIAEATTYYRRVLVIIDEIHRLKKDTQDFLLPLMESGKLIIIGLTTENPYRALNPAVRSRCHVYRLKEIQTEDTVELLKKVARREYPDLTISTDIFQYLAVASSNEIRSALNMLEIVSLLEQKELTLANVEEIIGQKAFLLDEKGENYYDILSAFIKSIRGSDVDASLHYLARLLKIGDLLIIVRRLQCLVYEDVGLANPAIGPRVYCACEAALNLGMPEARLPLAYATIDLALSPKSNSAYKAIDKALQDLDSATSASIPPHILNKELKSGKYRYLYPHDYPDDFVVQQYMPDEFIDRRYYEPKETGKYEKALKERLAALNKRREKK